MQVCWTLPNEHAFTVHIGGGLISAGGRGDHSAAVKGGGLKRKMQGKALQ